jgi:hypothetical protein
MHGKILFHSPKQSSLYLLQPRQEYYLVYQLISKHDILSDELRTVFYNPRDVGYLYLEAQFSKTGIHSLREVLKGFQDIRISSLAIVPETDMMRCLEIPTTDNDGVFVRGQWVQINRGLYRGDVGVVVAPYRDADSAKGVTVMVVPRLGLTNEDALSLSSSKRKRPLPRSSPQLFNPNQCTQQQTLIRHKEKHIFTHKSWRFEYGLQVKFYDPQSLSPAREMPSLLCHLFMQSKQMAGPGHDLFEMSSMPLPSFWSFIPGERVFAQLKSGKREGTVHTSPQGSLLWQSWCEVDLGDEGLQRVLAKDLQKDIILGGFIEVLARIHAGKTGFVVAQVDSLLGICMGQCTSGIVSSHLPALERVAHYGP